MDVGFQRRILCEYERVCNPLLCAHGSGHFSGTFCEMGGRKEVPAPVFCHGILRGVTSLIAVEEHHQCQLH